MIQAKSKSKANSQSNPQSKSKAKSGVTSKIAKKPAQRSAFGSALLESLGEVVAWKRGKTDLPIRTVVPMSSERVKVIRKSVAKSLSEFETRFGIPARTIEGWEQGRRQPDPAACVLLKVIEKNPELVEAAISGE